MVCWICYPEFAVAANCRNTILIMWFVFRRHPQIHLFYMGSVMVEPTLEAVLQALRILYHSPDKSEKERSSSWLEGYQKSVSYVFDLVYEGSGIWPKSLVQPGMRENLLANWKVKSKWLRLIFVSEEWCMVRVLETTNLAELQYTQGILFVPSRISYVSGKL